MTLGQFVAFFLEGDLYFGDYHPHVRAYFDSGRHGVCPDQVCILRFEDLVEHKVEAIRQLEQALFGEDRLTGHSATVAAATEFNTMKQSILKNPGTFHFNAEHFFRSGRTDDWKDHLTQRNRWPPSTGRPSQQWGALSLPLQSDGVRNLSRTNDLGRMTDRTSPELDHLRHILTRDLGARAAEVGRPRMICCGKAHPASPIRSAPSPSTSAATSATSSGTTSATTGMCGNGNRSSRDPLPKDEVLAEIHRAGAPWTLHCSTWTPPDWTHSCPRLRRTTPDGRSAFSSFN